MVAPLLLVLLASAGACRRSPGGSPEPNPGTSTGNPPSPLPSPLSTAAPPPLPASSCGPDIPDLVARVRPAVVNITTTHEVRSPQGSEFGAPFGFFFGNRPGHRSPFGDRAERRTSLGSGFVIDADGHVVTNAHVVEGADEVRIRLGDDRNFTAKVKGRDSKLDVAVLEIQGAKDLPFVTLGSSEQLRVGESVVAIGNPFGLGDTVTSGIVSAKSRTIGAGPYDDFIQTDASINPGNSGGPLFNVRGQVIGINTAINPNGQGIGFAIPIDDVKQAIPQLLTTGKVARGRLGVVIQPVDAAMAKAIGLDRPRGAMIAQVEGSGPGDRAGLRAGDVILAVDNTGIASSAELPRVVASHQPGSSVSLRVWRDKSEETVRVTLDPLTEKPGSSGPSSEDQSDRSHGLGIAITDSPDGVVVTDVASDGPAHGELLPGDIIVEVNREHVARANDVAQKIQKVPVGDPVMMKIMRQGTPRYVAIERR